MLAVSLDSDSVARVAAACRAKRYHTEERLLEAASEGADEELLELGFERSDTRPRPPEKLLWCRKRSSRSELSGAVEHFYVNSEAVR